MVTHSKVRRERLGRVELAAPVAHVWFLKSWPSIMANYLGVPLKDLENVIYYKSYLVLDPKNASLTLGQVLNEEDFRQAQERFGPNGLEWDIGVAAVKKMIQGLNASELSVKLREELAACASEAKRKKLVRRLKIVESFRDSVSDPSWMILEVIPVLPPDLRPLFPLEGGRFAASDLNDLYRRVINRNNRLKRLIDLDAPEFLIRNEKRLLQETVDDLFDNGRRSKTFKGSGRKPLKSLSDLLRGEQGRFRQNLLGKRVDFSGCSVIVSCPDLRLHQCGLPKKMALEIFKPFVYHLLVKKGPARDIKEARKLVAQETSEVWEALAEVVRERPILLNRAPTLNRLGIQAFEPILIEDKAIQLHPLVREAFNADFDGDQMTVHAPLSLESQIEAWALMMSSNNLLSPANGEPVIAPSQDIVLGLYYLTKEKSGAKGEGRLFASPEEVRLAFEAEALELQARIVVRLNGRKENTTCGRVLLYEIIPKEISFVDVNQVMNKSELKNLLAKCYRILGVKATVTLADDLKDLGFQVATKAGLSLCLANLVVPKNKNEILKSAQAEESLINERYNEGLLTKDAKRAEVVRVWLKAADEIAERAALALKATKLDGQPVASQGPAGVNPLFMTLDSGARGSKDQARQLVGVRGLVAKFTGEIVPRPITANFRVGLSAIDYFALAHFKRRCLTDEALMAENLGDLTRRLVEAAYDGVILEKDCGTLDGIEIEALEDSLGIQLTLTERILGRTAWADIISPVDGTVLVAAGEEIGEAEVKAIEKSGLKRIPIRSVLTCQARSGVCAKCYGRDLAYGKLVEIGVPIGVIAAQSLGEFSSRVISRTFPTYGEEKALLRVAELFEARKPIKSAVVSEIGGAVSFGEPTKNKNKIVVTPLENGEPKEYLIAKNKRVKVHEGDFIQAGVALTDGPLNPHDLLAYLGPGEMAKFLVNEIQTLYRLQGLKINDKHIEVIVHQMTRKIKVKSSGDTELLGGELVDRLRFEEINAKVRRNGGQPATAVPLLLGLTKVAASTESFISAVSSQDPIMVLTEAAMAGQVDNLAGLKENVFIGRLIPVGTGFWRGLYSRPEAD
jgi:DNA-directed RNA polymerase subunit beta'